VEVYRTVSSNQLKPTPVAETLTSISPNMYHICPSTHTQDIALIRHIDTDLCLHVIGPFVP
jgi:hypothetical protein